MANYTPILTITGSDSTGRSGIQSDIRTISDVGGYAVTVLSSVTLQDGQGRLEIHDLPADLIVEQARTIMADAHPRAVKVGLIRNADTIRRLRDEIVGSSRIVCAPGICASDGSMMIDTDTLEALRVFLFPETLLLMLRCNEAEMILGKNIASDDDMVETARSLVGMGVKWVLLRGGHQTAGRLTALLYGEGFSRFFTSYNTAGWQRHGVGGALSAAIATRLGLGDDVPTAIREAHDYIHSQVVYAVSETPGQRSADLYNRFMSLIAQHYQEAHDVSFYADRLSITARYLSRVTERMVSKSPKQVISNYLMAEACSLLQHTRLSIQEISDRLGFSSQSLFSKFFSAQAGCSPIEYRLRN